MIDACKVAQVKLMIAYRMQYEPLTLEAIQRLRSGAIGQIRTIEAAAGFDISPGVWRLQRKLAGAGSLMDIGIYALNATRYLTGEEPAEFKAFQTTHREDPRFAEVEDTVSWTTRFPSGILATVRDDLQRPDAWVLQGDGKQGRAGDGTGVQLRGDRAAADGGREQACAREDESGEGPDAVYAGGGCVGTEHRREHPGEGLG